MFSKQRGRSSGPGGFQGPIAGWTGACQFFWAPHIEDSRADLWILSTKTAIRIRILDRGVDFWHPKNIIFECMQQNNYFFIELTNVLWKLTTVAEKNNTFHKVWTKIDQA